MELGARIGLVLGVLFVAERLKMTHFRDSFWLNEIVASLSTVDGSSLRRPSSWSPSVAEAFIVE